MAKRENKATARTPACEEAEFREDSPQPPVHMDLGIDEMVNFNSYSLYSTLTHTTQQNAWAPANLEANVFRFAFHSTTLYIIRFFIYLIMLDVR